MLQGWERARRGRGRLLEGDQRQRRGQELMLRVRGQTRRRDQQKEMGRARCSSGAAEGAAFHFVMVQEENEGRVGKEQKRVLGDEDAHYFSLASGNGQPTPENIRWAWGTFTALAVRVWALPSLWIKAA